MVAVALGAPSQGEAQGFRVEGRVLRIAGTDTLPVAGTLVVLHGVTVHGGGPVDSAPTDRAGTYRLRAGRADTAAVYFVSADFAGINYVSRPLRGRAERRQADPLYVFDTSSVAPPITLSQRHVIVRAPSSDGSRQVLELLMLENAGSRTRIAHDTVLPVWEAALPRGALEFAVGESDVSAETVRRRGDTVRVFAPVPPGAKQIIIGYVLPGSLGRLALPLDQPIRRLDVLVEDATASLIEGPLVSRGVEEMEGVRFVRFEGLDLGPGTPIVVRFARAGVGLDRLRWVLIAAAGTALAAGLAAWWRGRGRAAPLAAVPPEALAAQIAALDARYETQPADHSADELERYRRLRAALKAQLNAALARMRGEP